MNGDSGRPPDNDNNNDAEASPGGRTGSHGTWWMIALLATPLLYILTVPPIVISVVLGKSFGPVSLDLHWALAYAEPYEWLARETPLRRPLRSYAEWWMERIRP